jgi:hypothetical protein
MCFEKNFDHKFDKKDEIYNIKIIPLDSYSKELLNGIIFVAYISYLVNKTNGQSFF